ncbi:MAG TPA: pantoate--beta-alanine ligase, partial [Nitrospirae bacterium]|nr:pantoate--beta-alanine ligase [Nitrospirota bacterium]
MQTIKIIKKMRAFSNKLRSEGRTIGFVPTMGALHEGHLSLVRRSKSENDVTVVSIFINPTQFGPEEDFEQYPRNMESDLGKLSGLSTDAVFIPDDTEMYPEGPAVSVHTGHIGEILCGASRPGHFDGVATVVARLFNAVMPNRTYFGQKDYQQTVVIKKMVREQGLDAEIIVCPIIREPDGLAISSRNAYLNTGERKAAAVLHKALKHGEDLMKKGADDPSQVIKEMEKVI